MKIWDTAGQERFMAITKAFYRQAQGVMLVFDVTKKQSFEKLEGWAENIGENVHANVTKYLVANKTDLLEDRAVSSEQGKEFAEAHDMKYFETSAKGNQNVKLIFESMAEDICARAAADPNESVFLKPSDPAPAPRRFHCC